MFLRTYYVLNSNLEEKKNLDNLRIEIVQIYTEEICSWTKNLKNLELNATKPQLLVKWDCPSSGETPVKKSNRKQKVLLN